MTAFPNVVPRIVLILAAGFVLVRLVRRSVSGEPVGTAVAMEAFPAMATAATPAAVRAAMGTIMAGMAVAATAEARIRAGGGLNAITAPSRQLVETFAEAL